MHDYRLAPDDAPPLVRSLARGWLWLGVAALIGSGLLAVLLVLSRTPGIQNVFPLRDFFRSALVVHVDLSVLIWFMAFASVLWTLAGNGALAALGRAALWLASAGTLLMTASPFFPDAHPLLNNYIPVLEQPVFFAGLGTAGLGFALAILRAPIDMFFDQVTVNDADPAKRSARLALLARFRDAVHGVADFSRIEG